MTRQKAQVTTMTMNLRFGLARDGQNGWDYRKSLVGEILKKYPADFLGFQEANHFQVEFLSQALPGYQVLGWHNKSEEAWQSNLIVAHPSWRCLGHRHYFLSHTPKINSKLPGATWPRQCVIGWFGRGEEQVLVGVTHFDFDSSVQEISGRLVLSFFNQFPLGLPRILMGDFNANPGSTVHAYFQAQGFEDLFAGEAASTFHDFTGRESGEQIDWILFQGGLTPIFREVVKDSFSGRYPSDHFPVRSGFAWTPQLKKLSEKLSNRFPNKSSNRLSKRISKNFLDEDPGRSKKDLP